MNPLSLIPAPYRLIIAIALMAVFLAAAYAYAYRTGFKRASDACSAEKLAAERASNVALSEANAKAKKSDERFSAIQQEMEKKQHENQIVIDAARKQLATVKRLRDPGYRAADCGGLPKDTTTPGGTVDATPPGYISNEFTEFLQEQAYAADKIAVYAKTCHEWVLSISE